MLFYLFGCKLLLGKFGFECGKLLKDNAIFFLFRFGLADAFDEFFKFFGEMRWCGRHYDIKYTEKLSTYIFLNLGFKYDDLK